MPSRVSRLVQTLLIGAMLALAIALSPGRALAVTGAVAGLVVDTANQPVAGATVTVANQSTLSDASGRYLVSAVAAGIRTAKAAKNGYLVSSAVSVTVVDAKTVTAPNLVLDARWAAVRGAVTDAGTKAPVVGAAVTVDGQKTSTNTYGTYRLNKVRAGSQTFTVTAAGYQTVSRIVTVPSDHSLFTVDFALGSASTAPATPTGFKGTATDDPSKGPLVSLTWDAYPAAANKVTSLKVVRNGVVLQAGYNPAWTAFNDYGDTAYGVTYSFSLIAVSSDGKESAPASVTVNMPSKTPTLGPGSTIYWNGSSTYLYGANYAWYNYGTDFGTGGWGKTTDWNAIAAGFAVMKASGVRIVRYLVFGDGRYAPDFNADGTVSGLDGYVLPDIDRMLQIAANNDVYLLLTVMDGAMWNNTTWHDGVPMGGHAAMVTNATAQQTFLDNALKPLLQHIAASPNKKYVLGYDLVNEPEANMATYWGGVNLQPSQVMAFVKRCTDYVHSYGGGAYATVGSATPYYVVYWKGLGLDFYQCHYYPWMDFGNGAGNGLPTYASLNLDRPCIVGEFPNATAGYGPGDTAPLTAKWYLDAIHAKGYAGAITWSFCVGDSATNWGAFQPLFTSWGQAHATAIGPK